MSILCKLKKTIQNFEPIYITFLGMLYIILRTVYRKKVKKITTKD